MSMPPRPSSTRLIGIAVTMRRLLVFGMTRRPVHRRGTHGVLRETSGAELTPLSQLYFFRVTQWGFRRVSRRSGVATNSGLADMQQR